MPEIIITKSYVLENGDLSGMFKVPKDKLTEDIEIALVRLRGKPAFVKLADEPERLRPFREPEHEALRQVMDKILDAVDEYRGEERELPLEGITASKALEKRREVLEDFADKTDRKLKECIEQFPTFPKEHPVKVNGESTGIPADLTAPLRTAPAEGYISCSPPPAGCGYSGKTVSAGDPIPDCPGCGKPLIFEARNCPLCREPIGKNENCSQCLTYVHGFHNNFPLDAEETAEERPESRREALERMARESTREEAPEGCNGVYDVLNAWCADGECRLPHPRPCEELE